MSGRLRAAVLLTLLVPACRGPVHTTEPRPPHAAPAAPQAATPSPLDAALRALLADPALARASWGVHVESLTTHRTLASIDADRLLTPASTMKVATLAVAAEQLGWDVRVDTTLHAVGRIENGVLQGDLVVVGAGDPTLDDWDGAATAQFAAWASALRAAGISRVEGRVIGDDRAFSDTGLGSGWAWDDTPFAYSAPVSALSFNQNAARVTITPSAVSTLARIDIAPPYAPLRLRNDVRTATDEVARPVALHPAAGGRPLTMTGQVAAHAPPAARVVAVEDGAVYYASALREGLLNAGLEVTGEAVGIRSLPTESQPVVTPDTQRAVRRSPTLAEMATTMMRLSQNLYAESLLRIVGRTVAGDGSAAAGRDVVQRRLAAWHIPEASVRMADGSGLSRYNLISPRALVQILTHMAADPALGPAFAAALPVAGRSGTLARRLQGTSAAGRVRAKTGSFTHARSLAGYVDTAHGDQLAFAFVVNDYGVDGAEVDRVADAMLRTLVER